MNLNTILLLSFAVLITACVSGANGDVEPDAGATGGVESDAGATGGVESDAGATGGVESDAGATGGVESDAGATGGVESDAGATGGVESDAGATGGVESDAGATGGVESDAGATGGVESDAGATGGVESDAGATGGVESDAGATGGVESDAGATGGVESDAGATGGGKTDTGVETSTVDTETTTPDSTAQDESEISNDISASPDAQRNGSNSVTNPDETTDNSTGADDSAAAQTGNSSQNGTETTLAPDNSTTTVQKPLEPDSSTEALPETDTDKPNSTEPLPETDTDKPNSTDPEGKNSTATEPSVPEKDNGTDASNATEPVQPPQPPAQTNQTDEPATNKEPPTEPQPQQPHTVKISETNLLLGKDNPFIELKGEKGEDLTDTWLVIHDASKLEEGETTLRFKHRLESTLGDSGLLLLNSTDLELGQDVSALQSVFVGLYNQADSPDNAGVLDVLLLSSDGQLDGELQEKFATITRFPLTIDNSLLSGLNDRELSLSRCTEDMSNAGFVVGPASPGAANECDLDSTSSMQMWLSQKNQPCPAELPSAFKDAVERELISGVNEVGHCGLTKPMVYGVKVFKSCVNTQETRVDVHFIFRTAYDFHLSLLRKVYQRFVEDPKHSVLKLTDSDYSLQNCTESCQAVMVNPHNRKDSDKDKKTQVTVGVVLACVGVFIAVLLVVVVYMKRKRRGILQFRMTRLDEEDDDMIGDMDDFVGNQGPTFRNFR